ncbi:hypothetical protein K435DRAFT_853181 [Dendrothele bispora CBS 962.96]|uniref:Uncharacterized protein n=1 Tax=Dendrothele bispora (strain CBS 962.96) TaxID=1314807 RepID=A0A4S8MHQ2_DENBC|nr:hypothetical protein K435DRAFT_853181 [Dendrothele bispora CBS 962.96]
MASTTGPSNPDFVSESPVRSGGAVKSTGVQRRANVRAHTTSSSSPSNLNSDNSANPFRAVSAINTFSRVTAQTQMRSIQMFNESKNTKFTQSTVNNVGGDDKRDYDIHNLRFQNIRVNISGNPNITLNFG